MRSLKKGRFPPFSALLATPERKFSQCQDVTQSDVTLLYTIKDSHKFFRRERAAGRKEATKLRPTDATFFLLFFIV